MLKGVQILILGILMLLFSVIWKREEKRRRVFDMEFEQCADYMNQMLLSFGKTGKIDMALMECSQLFQEGELKIKLNEALEIIEHSYSANNRHVALGMIERGYSCRQLQLMHEFMLEAEQSGGETTEAITLLKEEHRQFRLRISFYQTQCRKQCRNILVSIIAGMMLCASLVYLVPDGKMLVTYSLYQNGTLLMFGINVLIACFSVRFTSKNWLIEQKRYSDKEIEEKILKYLNNEKFLGRRTMKKIIQKEVSNALPEWILRLSLLLQHNDVAGAVEKSEKVAPVILKHYIHVLIEGIHDRPGAAEPYLEFLEEFKTPESITAMRTLYMVSVGGCTDISKQLMQLLERTKQVEDQNMKSNQEKSMSLFYMLFLAPTLTASLKLIVDMSILLVSFMAQLGLG